MIGFAYVSHSTRVGKEFGQRKTYAMETFVKEPSKKKAAVFLKKH